MEVAWRGEPAVVKEVRSTNVLIESDRHGEIAVNPESLSEEVTFEGGDAAPVSDVKGIGPTYTERLEEEGIETVEDLREAGANALVDAGMNEGQAQSIYNRVA